MSGLDDDRDKGHEPGSELAEAQRKRDIKAWENEQLKAQLNTYYGKGLAMRTPPRSHEIHACKPCLAKCDPKDKLLLVINTAHPIPMDVEHPVFKVQLELSNSAAKIETTTLILDTHQARQLIQALTKSIALYEV